jgi:hypothetical protein
MASPAARTSRSLARAREHTVEFLMTPAMALMASASPWAGGGEARLDDIHAQAFQLPGDADLLVLGHGGAGALLAVAQSGIENDQSV